MISRRNFIKAASGLFLAPAIVRAESLMRIDPRPQPGLGVGYLQMGFPDDVRHIESPDLYPVFVGVNGMGYKIPRNTIVAVPQAVEQVLRDSVNDHITIGDDGLMRHDTSQKFPYDIVGSNPDGQLKIIVR